MIMIVLLTISFVCASMRPVESGVAARYTHGAHN